MYGLGFRGVRFGVFGGLAGTSVRAAKGVGFMG